MFLLALATRLAYWLVVDQPLLYTHQYTYFSNALRIAEHPQPLHYVLTSDEWRTWDGHWTIAPLYHLFLAALIGLFGPGLGAIRLVQCLLDAGSAVGVALLARACGARHFVAAGVVYALWFSAIEMPSWTMTENLHTAIFLAAVLLAARAVENGSSRSAVLAGAVCAVAAFARSVSTGFLGLAAAWYAWRGLRASRSWRGAVAGVLMLAGGLAVILPWTARNAFVIGDAVLIESAAFENIWFANHFTDAERYRRQEEYIHSRPTPADKRKAALHFAVRGWTRDPGQIPEKARSMFWHFIRPEGLHGVLVVERSAQPWYHALTLLLDDLPLLLMLPLFAAFWVGGRPTPARTLILIWAGYYLVMVTVVFHNEVRYRSALMPFAFAGAAAGWDALRNGDRRRRAQLGAALGVALAFGTSVRYLRPGVDAVQASALRSEVRAAVASSDVDGAFAAAAAASTAAPSSARPWQDLGRDLLHVGQHVPALRAYGAGADRATSGNWRSVLVQPRLLRATGDTAGADLAVTALQKLSWSTDPWMVLETAWLELPAPTTDDLQLGADDYGAARGFQHPRGVDPVISRPHLEWNRYPRAPQPPPGLHRWTRGHAWLRLVPSCRTTCDVTLVMGVPFPAPVDHANVRVRAGDGPWQTLRVDRTLSPHTLRVPAPPAGEPLMIALQAPTWTIRGEPAGQGVRIDRMSVTPAP